MIRRLRNLRARSLMARAEMLRHGCPIFAGDLEDDFNGILREIEADTLATPNAETLLILCDQINDALADIRGQGSKG